MRLISLFLLFSNIVFSQNPTTDQATKQKPSQEIGINLGRYFFREYGVVGFYKKRKKDNESSKGNWKQHINYRLSGGFFFQDPENQLKTNKFLGSQIFYRDSVYFQKKYSSYLIAGFEKQMKHEMHSYWIGFQAGPYYARRIQVRDFQRFDGEVLLISSRFRDIYKDYGLLIDINTGYKYAFNKHLNLGIELSFWWTSLYTYGISVDNFQIKTISKSFNFNGEFNLLNSIFVSYVF
jgi:hypothetical protein